MDSKDVIQLLRLQRHDLMNDLQIVHGYLSMGKTDKVKKKVSDIIEAFNKERKLMNSNSPEFALWLIQVKWLYNNIQITYDIHTENELQAFDKRLTFIGNAIIECVTTVEFEVVEIVFLLKDNNTGLDIEVTLENGNLQENKLREKLSEELKEVLMKVQELDSKVTYTLTIPA